MTEKKYVLVGKKKHYYTEHLEAITFICPVRGQVTQEVMVKTFEPVDYLSDGFIIEDRTHGMMSSAVFNKSAWE